jgi:hypothetical protein
MTSREHARRLMLILLSSPGGPDQSAAATGEAREAGDERQVTDGRDDSTDGDERRTRPLVEALVLT